MNFLEVTQETIQKQWNWMLIPKFLTPALLVTLIVLVIRLTTYIANIDSRSFSTVEERVKAELYLQHAPTPVEAYKTQRRLKDLEEADIILSQNVAEIKEVVKRIEKTIKGS